MFNPEMMRAAQEMASKLTPEQMRMAQQVAQGMTQEQMLMAQQMAQGMTPEQMRQAASMAQNVTPDQMRQAASMTQGMTPEQMRQAASMGQGMMPEQMASESGHASAGMSAQQKYKYDASLVLKADGNRLHGQRQYGEAAEKYGRAISNLEGIPGPQAVELRLACQNNLSNCHLMLERWQACVELCCEVLRADGANRKALYRRGQALSALGQHDEAVRDLQRALELSPESERGVVAEKLEEARQKQRHETRGIVIEEVVEEDASQPHQHQHVAKHSEEQQQQQEQHEQAASTQQRKRVQKEHEGLVVDSSDEETPEPHVPTCAAAPEAAAAAMPPVVGPMGMDPAQLAQAQAMLQSNPEVMRSSAAMMASMSDEQLAAAMSQSGMPGMTPEMARMAASMFKNLPPEQLQAMASQAAGAMGQRVGGVAPAAAAPAAPAVPPAEMLEQMRRDPDMMRNMASMLESMPAEQLASLPGAPAGMKLDAAQVKMAAQMMKNMSAEELARMADMAAKMGAAGSAGVGATPAVAGDGSSAVLQGSEAAAAPGFAPTGFGPGMDASQMRKMMEDPAMLKSMQAMMRSVDSETLASMMASSGLKVTPEQAKQMVDKLGGVSDTHLEILSKLMRWFNTAAAAYQQARAWVLSNGALVVGLLILVLGLMLRWLGWM